MSDMNYNRKPNHCCNAKCDPCHDKKDPCRDKDHKPCRDLETRVEFRYDERTPDPATPIPTTTPGVELLAVTFDEVEAGNRVWLSGVIAVDSNVAQIVRLTIRIVKDSPNINPTTIYTLTVEIDVSSADDVSAIPFSHVDVNNVDLFDVRYSVFASANAAGLVSQGPNTLTALRFENK
ncbi:hypothetical protein QYB59_001315 [Clostridium perfringens]|nr:hypothetical protein [Clostridium perfringens]